MGIDARITRGQPRMLFDSKTDVGTASPSHPGTAIVLSQIECRALTGKHGGRMAHKTPA